MVVARTCVAQLYQRIICTVITVDRMASSLRPLRITTLSPIRLRIPRHIFPASLGLSMRADTTAPVSGAVRTAAAGKGAGQARYSLRVRSRSTTEDGLEY